MTGFSVLWLYGFLAGNENVGPWVMFTILLVFVGHVSYFEDYKAKQDKNTKHVPLRFLLHLSRIYSSAFRSIANGIVNQVLDIRASLVSRMLRLDIRASLVSCIFRFIKKEGAKKENDSESV